MTIPINQNSFSSLPTDSVGHICFAPMVPVYQNAMRRRGDLTPQEVRAEFFKTLTAGQRALFMFFSYYDHAVQSEEEFERISYSYLSSNIFGAVKKGTEYFGDNGMWDLLSEAERILSEQNRSKIAELYRRFLEISPRTLEIIGTCIKKNPSEFVTLVE